MEKDFELVKRVLSGDRKAFRNIIVDYERLVNHIVYRMIPDYTEREDICQEVFVKVYQNLDKFRGESRLSTWIGRIAANRCIDFLQAKRLPLSERPLEEIHHLSDNNSDNPGDSLEKKNLGDILNKEISRIPNPYRTILTLYHIDELSYNEIGTILKMPEGTVKSYLFRARKKLKEILTARYNIEELWV